LAGLLDVHVPPLAPHSVTSGVTRSHQPAAHAAGADQPCQRGGAPSCARHTSVSLQCLPFGGRPRGRLPALRPAPEPCVFDGSSRAAVQRIVEGSGGDCCCCSGRVVPPSSETACGRGRLLGGGATAASTCAGGRDVPAPSPSGPDVGLTSGSWRLLIAAAAAVPAAARAWRRIK
jgi:hypothetical protein